MMWGNYICALDISSTKIAAVVAEIKKKRIMNIFFEAVASKGIQKGAIVNSLDLIGALEYVLKNLKGKSGINIKFIYSNISGADILTKHSRAVMPLAERGNKVIGRADIQEVNEQARILGSSLDEEIIHTITHSYVIDSNNNILNPLGLYSHRLGVDLYLICGKLSFIQGLIRVVHQSGYEIKELFFSGLVTSQAVFNKDFPEAATVLCDIGSDITELLLFRNRILHDVKILNIGGEDLTLSICENLKIPFDLAEDIKRSYTNIGNDNEINNQKEILIKQDSLYKPISQRLLSGILTPKTKLICENIRKVMEKLAPLDEINNVVTVGRTALQAGFLETLENTLGISVKLGRITNPLVTSCLNKDNGLLGQGYLTYLTSLGIICQVLQGQEPPSLPTHHTSRNPVLRTIHKFKELYQEYF